MTPTFSDLVARLQAAGRIGADDVLALRGEIYGGAEVTEDEMTALVALDAVAERAPEWGELYAEAMTDYLVRQQEPRDYVDEAKAAWLMRVLPAELKADSGFEALARVLETAESAPAALDSFALQRAKAAVAARGAVSAADVVLLRRLVFAGGGADNIGVSREEADALFDVDDACRGGANDPAWADFFGKAVADSLTAVSPFRLESREDASRDDAWLASRESKAAFMGHMFAHAPKVASALRDIFHPYADMAKEWAAPEAAMEAAETAAATVTDAEARWLTGRLGAGDLSEAERQLIELLKAHAVEVSDILKPRFDAASATAAHDWTAPTFGHRTKAPA